MKENQEKEVDEGLIILKIVESFLGLREKINY